MLVEQYVIVMKSENERFANCAQWDNKKGDD